MRLIYKMLYTKKTFWGIVRVKSGGWRIGFGCGFIELFTGLTGTWLPRESLAKRLSRGVSNGSK